MMYEESGSFFNRPFLMIATYVRNSWVAIGCNSSHVEKELTVICTKTIFFSAAGRLATFG